MDDSFEAAKIAIKKISLYNSWYSLALMPDTLFYESCVQRARGSLYVYPLGTHMETQNLLIRQCRGSLAVKL